MYYVGISYLFSDAIDSAYIYLNKSRILDNKFLNTYIYLADVYAKLENKDSAKICLRFVIDNGMKDTTLYARELLQSFAKICGLYLEEKNFKELQKIGKEWTDYDPKSQYAFLYYAISFQGLGDVDGACRNYKRVLQIDPKNKSAKDALSKLSCP